MRQLFFMSCLFWQVSIFAQSTPENYPVDSASIEQPGVPRGEVLKFTFDQSKIFPVPGASTGSMFLRNIKLINRHVSM